MLKNYLTIAVKIVWLLWMLVGLTGNSHASSNHHSAKIDLTGLDWGQGKAYPLDTEWDLFQGVLLTPAQLAQTDIPFRPFPVPEVWGRKSKSENPPPALGAATYRVKIKVPSEVNTYFLYLPDMPSAYVMWANNQVVASNGTIGFSQTQEQPGFVPKVVPIRNVSGDIELVLQLSNYHYREGGIWFSLKLTDDSGYFDVAVSPLIWAVCFGSILIAIGLYNLSLFVFRSREVAALYFGLLCITVGVRRLLIDERVIYLFDAFSWSTLQRIEHLSFYLTLPLFASFFTALFKDHVPKWGKKAIWVLILPFVLICLGFSARVYTELNVSFQILIMIFVSASVFIYLKLLFQGAPNIKTFGLSLLILALTVTHDVLKANDYLHTDNIAHFGVLAFVIFQSISLQRRYLKSFNLVEEMSEQLEKHNRQLLEIDEFKDEFLATTSHELRTPLQGISGLAKVLKEDAENTLSDEQKQKLGLIANTSERLRVLVNDILDFSSIKHGKLKLHPTTVDLNDLAEIVMTTLKSTLSGKDVVLKADIDVDCRYIQADTFRLQQVLFNLIGNAIKYTHAGEIKLVARMDDEELLIEVIDTGSGIPPEKQESLFQPFEQVHVDGHFSASGTGLGLSISKKLVELHSGELTLDSTLGQGTTVCLRFPLTILINHVPTPMEDRQNYQLTLNAPEEPEKAQDSVVNDDYRALIFVVDDEPLNCELLASLLSAENYRVEVFDSGLEVLKRLSQQAPDLILLDYMMPKMNGIEVCRSIRQTHEGYELPIMMLTARHQVSDIVAALNAGANDYLCKPFNDKELIARVQSQISIRGQWLSTKENQKLKQEIERRCELEEQLADMNAQLIQALDFSNDALLMLNNEMRIEYTNAAAADYLKRDSGSLVGTEITQCVEPAIADQFKSALMDLQQDPKQFSVETPEHIWNVTVKKSEKSGLRRFTLLIQVSGHKLSVADSQDALSDLTQELYSSRKRIEEIELALRQVVPSIEERVHQPTEDQTTVLAAHKSDEKAPELATSHLNSEELNSPQGNPKEQVSDLLRLSLGLWEQYTGKGKVELAEQSRCWRVYVDGTTVKTRTFDKYLSARTIPDRPRWRAVVRTAHYVIAQCGLDKEHELELKALTSSVEEHFA